MAHFLSKRAAAALAVAATLPLLAACETMEAQKGAAGSIVAANAPIASMIAKGWILPETDSAVTAGRLNQGSAHEVQSILPPKDTGHRAIEVTELTVPAKTAQIAGMALNPGASAGEPIETADTLQPLQSE